MRLWAVITSLQPRRALVCALSASVLVSVIWNTQSATLLASALFASDLFASDLAAGTAVPQLLMVCAVVLACLGGLAALALVRGGQAVSAWLSPAVYMDHQSSDADDSADAASADGVIVFPVSGARPHAPSCPQEVEDSHEMDAPDQTGPMRILAAEDHPNNREVLEALLEPLQPELTFAENGADAVQAWKTGRYDVILMDIQMPKMSGIEATRIIRQTEAETGAPPTPIIAVTANVMRHQVEEYLRVGMNDCIGKPVDIIKLFAAIEAVLDDAPKDGPQAGPNDRPQDDRPEEGPSAAAL